jgi:hypothetical protein
MADHSRADREVFLREMADLGQEESAILAKLMDAPAASERRLVDEVLRLPCQTVHRQDRDWLIEAGMSPRNCHINAAIAASAIGAKLVSGWWHLGGILVLHSLITDGEVMNCVTPHSIPVMEFRADPHVRAVEESPHGLRVLPRRAGRFIPPRLRIDPQKTVEDVTSLITQILNGAHPSALKVPESLAGYLTFARMPAAVT